MESLLQHCFSIVLGHFIFLCIEKPNTFDQEPAKKNDRREKEKEREIERERDVSFQTQ